MERVERRGVKGWGPVPRGLWDSLAGWAVKLPAAAGPHRFTQDGLKVHQCILNRKSASSSSLSVRACSDTAVPSPRSQRVVATSCICYPIGMLLVEKDLDIPSPTPPTATSRSTMQILNIQRRSQELKLWYVPAFGVTQHCLWVTQEFIPLC